MSVTYDFVHLSSLTMPYSNTSFILNPPTSPSTGAVTFYSSNVSVATIDGNIVTITGTGSITLTLTRQADDTYRSSVKRMTLIVTEVNTVLSNFDNMVKTISDENFTLIQPTSNNSLGSFFYTSSNELVAEVYGNIVKIIGIGTTNITATQESSGEYNSASIISNLIVNKTDTILSDFNDLTYSYSNELISINQPLSNNPAPFTYYSLNEEVARISENNIQLIKSGTAIIRATQASTDYYNSASIDCTLNVTKIVPELSDFIIPTKTYGDVSFVLSDPETNGDGEFTFTSSDNTRVSISGRTVNILSAGLVSITATQGETNTYLSTSITSIFIVNKAPATIGDFSVSEKIYGSGSFILSDPNSNSNGEFIFSSSNNEVATIYEKTVTLVGGGETTITAIQTESDNYLSAIKTTVLIVNRATTTLSNFNIPEKKYGDNSFNLTKPTSDSDGAFFYSSSDETVAKIVGTTLSVIGAGSASITARQIETTNNLSATIVTTINVIKATPILGDFANLTKTFGDDPFNLSPPSSNSTGLFSYSSSNSAVATIVESNVTIVGAGTVTITVTQEATANYFAASIIFELIVNKAIPTLGDFANLTKTFGDDPFNLSPPSSNSTGLLSYSSSNSAVATIVESNVTIVGAGTVTITVTQEATANYLAATQTCSLIVSKATPLLSRFNNLTKTYSVNNFSLVDPLSISPGQFSYSILDNSIASISGSTVTLLGIGSTTVRALQLATSNYNSASIECQLIVDKATPVISNFNNITKMIYDDDFFLQDPSSTSPGTFSYLSSNSYVASVSGKFVTINDGGKTTILARQEETTLYTSASITCSITILKRETILSNFGNLEKKFGDNDFTLVQPTSNRVGSYSYLSSNPLVAIVSDNVVKIVGGGSTTITALQAESAEYAEKTITSVLTVSKINPVLSNVNVIYVNGEYQIRFDSTSNGTYSYVFSDNSAVRINPNNTLTFIKSASVIVKILQNETANYFNGTYSTIIDHKM
jgi:hypothetical protein